MLLGGAFSLCSAGDSEIVDAELCQWDELVLNLNFRGGVDVDAFRVDRRARRNQFLVSKSVREVDEEFHFEQGGRDGIFLRGPGHQGPACSGFQSFDFELRVQKPSWPVVWASKRLPRVKTATSGVLLRNLAPLRFGVKCRLLARGESLSETLVQTSAPAVGGQDDEL